MTKPEIRTDAIFIRLNREERALVNQLVAREERCAPDAIRRLVRQAVQAGDAKEEKHVTPKTVDQ